MKPALRHRARRLAVQSLYQWQISENTIYSIKKHHLSEAEPERVDIDYYEQIFTDITSKCTEIDALFSDYLDRPLNDVSPVELAILRLGTYELSERLDIPYRVCLNESIQLAKIFGAEEAHRFVNSVLDQVAKHKRDAERQQ